MVGIQGDGEPCGESLKLVQTPKSFPNLLISPVLYCNNIEEHLYVLLPLWDEMWKRDDGLAITPLNKPACLEPALAKRERTY